MKANLTYSASGEISVLLMAENDDEADTLRRQFMRLSAEDDCIVCAASTYSEIKDDKVILAVASGEQGEVLTDKSGETATIEIRLFRSAVQELTWGKL